MADAARLGEPGVTEGDAIIFMRDTKALFSAPPRSHGVRVRPDIDP